MWWMRLVLAMACMAAACGRGRRHRTSASGSDESRLLTKVRGYLDCLNDHSSTVFLIEDGYREHFALAAPTVNDAVRIAPSPDPEHCIDAIATARSLPPRIPKLEQAGDAFAAALASVHQLTGAAHSFYDHGSKAYAPARGIALHPQLLAAFDSFDQAQASLFDQVFTINRSVHLAQVARRDSASGPTLASLAEHVQLDAEGLVPYAAEPSDRVDATDLSGLEAQLARLETSIETMSSYAAGHADEVEAFGGLEPFLDGARACATSARELAARARDHVAYSETEKLMIGAGNAAEVPGTPAAMVRAYNHFVQIR